MGQTGIPAAPLILNVGWFDERSGFERKIERAVQFAISKGSRKRDLEDSIVAYVSDEDEADAEDADNILQLLLKVEEQPEDEDNFRSLCGRAGTMIDLAARNVLVKEIEAIATEDAPFFLSLARLDLSDNRCAPAQGPFVLRPRDAGSRPSTTAPAPAPH